MNKIRKFMEGRYGFDQLAQALIVITLIISLIASVTRMGILNILSYLVIAYAIFRITSRNIQTRTQENLKYCKINGFVKNKIQQMKHDVIGTKTHRYFKCIHCKQTIRVPRGKGKICITCPKCKTEFMKKT